TNLLNIGQELHSHGELARAREMLIEGSTISREINQKATSISALSLLAILLVDEGDLAAATARAEEARALAQSIGSKVREAVALSMLAQIALDDAPASRGR